MAPYRGVQYHLKEQRLANQKPENVKELFNLRHSSLRNVVECIFGVLKRQWQVLGGKGCEYSIDTQTDLFQALIGLYNFGKQRGDTFDDAIEVIAGLDNDIEPFEKTITAQNKWMEKMRDNIAVRIWNDYLLYIRKD
jgi:DDE superfamily endonuclease